MQRGWRPMRLLPLVGPWIGILLLASLSMGWVEAAAPSNDKCGQRIDLTLGNTVELRLATLFEATEDSSPCLQNDEDRLGIWYSVVGDGTNYTLSVCNANRTNLATDLYVGIHVDNNCQPYTSCLPGSCAQLECVVSSDSLPELESSVDFCTQGITWQSQIYKEYQILFYTKSKIGGRVYITVNGDGCDGLNTGSLRDECGECNGDGTSCGYRGCDGIVGSLKRRDVCGVCGGNNDTCLTGCDRKPNSQKLEDPCGICGGDGSSCRGCDGIPVRDPTKRKVLDPCGVCGGNGSTCADCRGIPNGPNLPDVCGECGGNGTSCLDCAGVPFGNCTKDDCDVCGGDNSTCYGCDGVKCGAADSKSMCATEHQYSGLKYDLCGDCGGNNTCFETCDENLPFSQVDACGMCNGDNSSCTCVLYEDFTVPEMDCRLVRFSLGNIVQQIDALIATLNEIRNATAPSQLEVDKNTILRYVGDEILDSNDFLQSCVNYYASMLNSFIHDDVAPAAGVGV